MYKSKCNLNHILFFLPAAVTVGTGGKQIIASNCQSTNFNGESSFEVALEPATSMITFTGRTDTDIAVLELQYQVSYIKKSCSTFLG